VDSIKIYRVILDTLLDTLRNIDTTIFDTSIVDSSYQEGIEFLCKDKCLYEWSAPGFNLQDKYSLCNYIEYYDSTSRKTVTRSINSEGITETLMDSSFNVLSVFEREWVTLSSSADTFCVSPSSP